MDTVLNGLELCKGAACMPIPSGDAQAFECLYNGTCVFLVDGSRFSNEDAEKLANLLPDFLSLEVNERSGGDEERLYHILLVELGRHKDRPNTLLYRGAGSVVWASSCGEFEVNDHPLTRDALPALAKLYGQAQDLAPDPESVAAAKSPPPKDPWRETMERNLLTHDFVEGRRLDETPAERESTRAYEQVCKHCGFTFPPCYNVPICSVVRG